MKYTVTVRYKDGPNQDFYCQSYSVDNGCLVMIEVQSSKMENRSAHYIPLANLMDWSVR